MRSMPTIRKTWEVKTVINKKNDNLISLKKNFISWTVITEQIIINQ